MSTNGNSPRIKAIQGAEVSHRENALPSTTPSRDYKSSWTININDDGCADSDEFEMAPEYPLDQHDNGAESEPNAGCETELTKVFENKLDELLEERHQTANKLRNLKANTCRVDFRSAIKSPFEKRAMSHEAAVLQRTTMAAAAFREQWGFVDVKADRIEEVFKRGKEQGQHHAYSEPAASEATDRSQGFIRKQTDCETHLIEQTFINNSVTLHDNRSAVNSYQFFQENHGELSVQNNAGTGTSVKQTPARASEALPKPRSVRSGSSSSSQSPARAPSWYQGPFRLVELSIRTVSRMFQFGLSRHGFRAAVSLTGVSMIIAFMSMPGRKSKRIFLGLTPLMLTGYSIIGSAMSAQTATKDEQLQCSDKEPTAATDQRLKAEKPVTPERPSKLEQYVKVTTWQSHRRFCILPDGRVKSKKGARAGFHDGREEIRSKPSSARRCWAKEISSHEMLDRLMRVFQVDRIVTFPLWKIKLGNNDGSYIEIWRDEPSPVMREHGELYILFVGTERGLTHAEDLLTFLLSEDLD